MVSKKKIVFLNSPLELTFWITYVQAGRPPVPVPDEVYFFKLSNPSSCTMALGSTQPLTEMSTGNLLGIKSGRHVRLTTLPPSMSRMSENVRTSTSCTPKGLHGLYRDNFTFNYTWRRVQIMKFLIM
jgi:hypothetical protein